MSSEVGEEFPHEGHGAEKGQRQASTNSNEVGNGQIVPDKEPQPIESKCQMSELCQVPETDLGAHHLSDLPQASQPENPSPRSEFCDEADNLSEWKRMNREDKQQSLPPEKPEQDQEHLLSRLKAMKRTKTFASSNGPSSKSQKYLSTGKQVYPSQPLHAPEEEISEAAERENLLSRPGLSSCCNPWLADIWCLGGTLPASSTP